MQRLRIYGFKDPRDEKLHYVGKSRNPYVRLGEHYRDQRPPTLGTPKGGYARRYNPEMAAWLDSLIQEDIFPEVVILHIVEEGEDWQALERKFIAEYRASGHPLVNKTIGGRGGVGLRHTPEWKAERSRYMSNRVVSSLTRAKVSEQMKNSPDRIAKMRNGWEKWSKTEEGRATLSRARKGKVLSEEHKRAIGNATRRRWELIHATENH